MAVPKRKMSRSNTRTRRSQWKASVPAGLRRWSAADRPDGGRALVLGGGGATGIAWEAGVVAGLADLGVDLRNADTMIGTSAGSVVAAHLRAGTDLDAGRVLARTLRDLGVRVRVNARAIRFTDGWGGGGRGLHAR